MYVLWYGNHEKSFLLSYWLRYDYIYDYNNLSTMKRTFYYPTGQGMTIFMNIIIRQPWKDTFYSPTGLGMIIITCQPSKDIFYYPTSQG